MSTQVDMVPFLKIKRLYLLVCYYRLYLIKDWQSDSIWEGVVSCALWAEGPEIPDFRVVMTDIIAGEYSLHLISQNSVWQDCTKDKSDAWVLKKIFLVWRRCREMHREGCRTFCRGVHRRDEQLEACWMLRLQCCPFFHRLYKRERERELECLSPI